ncbi:MAG: NUDIX hydrolase [Candidatus Micrarchaeota archaeon]|nr:NUDIX hydrolase [Candidatus Micrarchaeota archaeon]
MVEEVFQVGVKALIRDGEGRFLIVKEKGARYWDLPGGRIERNESVIEAFSRELEEEIGIKEVGVLGLRDAVVSKIKIDVGKEKVGLFLIVYDCRLPKNQVLQGKGLEHQWADRAELSKMLGNKFPEEFLKNL